MINPGKNFSTVVTSSTNDFRVTCSGAEVPFDARDNNNGTWTIDVDGADVDCPGPLVIEKKSGGLWVEIGRWTVNC